MKLRKSESFCCFSLIINMLSLIWPKTKIKTWNYGLIETANYYLKEAGKLRFPKIKSVSSISLTQSKH